MTQITVGGATLEMVALGSIRKYDGEMIRSRPINVTPFWPLQHILPPESHLVCYPTLTPLSDGQ